jgi:hypothetical protein
MKVSWDDEIPNMWQNKKCSKPPTRTNMTTNRKVQWIDPREDYPN